MKTLTNMEKSKLEKVMVAKFEAVEAQFPSTERWEHEEYKIKDLIKVPSNIQSMFKRSEANDKENKQIAITQQQTIDSTIRNP